MKKLTSEELIKRCNLMYNNFYIYNKVEYKGSHVKITIVCPKHGDFTMSPNKHVQGQGQGCQYCSGKKTKFRNIYTQL